MALGRGEPAFLGFGRPHPRLSHAALRATITPPADGLKSRRPQTGSNHAARRRAQITPPADGLKSRWWNGSSLRCGCPAPGRRSSLFQKSRTRIISAPWGVLILPHENFHAYNLATMTEAAWCSRAASRGVTSPSSSRPSRSASVVAWPYHPLMPQRLGACPWRLATARGKKDRKNWPERNPYEGVTMRVYANLYIQSSEFFDFGVQKDLTPGSRRSIVAATRGGIVVGRAFRGLGNARGPVRTRTVVVLRALNRLERRSDARSCNLVVRLAVSS